MSQLYGTVLGERTAQTGTKFKFTRSETIDRIVLDTDKDLIKDFDRLKKKLIASWEKYAEDEKLQDADGAADIVIDRATNGRELTVSLISGTKTSFLFGFREIASAMGFKHGDRGRAGDFDFNYMPKEAFENAKRAAERVSRGTIDRMVNGDSKKFFKNNVRNIVKNGIKEGLPATDISKKIAGMMDETKYWKAAEITRTEIPMAYNLGRIDGARKDGLKKARIELGGRPCKWCMDEYSRVRTLNQAEIYMSEHHPNNDCTVVPLIDFDYYGIKPPEGYYPDEPEGPTALPKRPKIGKPKIPIPIPKKVAPPSPPLPPPLELPVTTNPMLVGTLPKESVAGRSERIRRGVAKKPKLIAPKKPKKEFTFELHKKYNTIFVSKYYDGEKAKLFLVELEKVYGGLNKKILAKLQKDFPLEVWLKTPKKYFGKDVLGTYEINESRLRLLNKLFREGKYAIGRKISTIRLNFEWISNHEITHHIWHKGMSQKQRKAWIKIWDSQKTGGRISWYADIDAEEGFSEVMAAFSRNPKALKKVSPEAYRYIIEVILPEA